MIRSHVYFFALAMVCACAGSAHAQATSAGGSTVAPAAQAAPASSVLEKGLAPHMKVQVLNHNSDETTYAVIFGKGDELIAGLTEFAQEKHLGGSRITGIGGIEDATIGFFELSQKRHRPMLINQQSEVLSLLGDIALFHDKPVVHLHMVVGFPDGSAHGGHLLKAHVWPTMEVIVTEYQSVAMHKKLDAETGAALIDPSEKQ